MTDLCFLKVPIFKLVRSYRRSNVAQWSLDDLCAIASAALIYSLIKMFENS